MIANERQYKITKAQLAKFKEAAESFNVAEAAKRIGSSTLARAELEALRSEAEILSTQIREYEALKSGAVRVLKAENLSELPTILVQARIARGLSQRDLAGRLGLKEQQIQRYESENYRSASLARLAKVAEALDLDITEKAKFRKALPATLRTGTDHA